MKITDSCSCGSRFSVKNQTGENTYETIQVHKEWKENHSSCRPTVSGIDTQEPKPEVLGDDPPS